MVEVETRHVKNRDKGIGTEVTVRKAHADSRAFLQKLHCPLFLRQLVLTVYDLKEHGNVSYTSLI